MSINFVSEIPSAYPRRLDAVYYDVDLPWISARLLFFANLRLILALDADESMKQTFIPTFAIDAIRRKYYGYNKVVI